MLVSHAQSFTPEQLNAAGLLIGGLIVANIGGIVGWCFRALKKHWKKDQDLNAAFTRIRAIEKKLKITEFENSEEQK